MFSALGTPNYLLNLMIYHLNRCQFESQLHSNKLIYYKISQNISGKAFFIPNRCYLIFFLCYSSLKSSVISVWTNSIVFSSSKSEDHMKKLRCKRKGHF